MPGEEVAAGRCVAYGALVDPERTSEEPESTGTAATDEQPSRPVKTHTAPGPRTSGAAASTAAASAGSPAAGAGSPAAGAGSPAVASAGSPAAAPAASPAAVTGVEAAAEPTRVTRTRPVERRTTELRETRPASVPEPRTGTEYRAGDVPTAEPTVPTNIYRARRPAVAVLLIIPAIGVALLLLRALAISAFGDDPFNIGGVISSACALAALPLLVAGLYGLVTGAAHGAEQYGFKVWARPPLAYLLVALSLIASAALAIRAA
jgi:hypothetical protein